MKTRQTNKIDLEVSKKLKARRLELGFTQEQLAQALGVTFQQIQKYERGTNRISSSSLFSLAEILQTEISYFFEAKHTNAYALPNSVLTYVAEDQATFGSLTEVEKKLLHELIFHFNLIKDPKLKQSIIDLAKSLKEVP